MASFTISGFKNEKGTFLGRIWSVHDPYLEAQILTRLCDPYASLFAHLEN
jgi:hypothetical protein